MRPMDGYCCLRSYIVLDFVLASFIVVRFNLDGTWPRYAHILLSLLYTSSLNDHKPAHNIPTYFREEECYASFGIV